MENNKPEENILQLIQIIRNQKVMLDSDLANMFGVSTKRINEQVKRNPDRFPGDLQEKILQLQQSESDQNHQIFRIY